MHQQLLNILLSKILIILITFYILYNINIIFYKYPYKKHIFIKNIFIIINYYH